MAPLRAALDSDRGAERVGRISKVESHDGDEATTSVVVTWKDGGRTSHRFDDAQSALAVGNRVVARVHRGAFGVRWAAHDTIASSRTQEPE